MTIPVTSYPEDGAVLTYPKEPTKYKEHDIIKTAREVGVTPLCDVRAPKLIETIVDAR